MGIRLWTVSTLALVSGCCAPLSHMHLEQYTVQAVMIEVPTKLTQEHKDLLEQFAKTTGEDISSKNDSLKDKIKKVFK